MRKFIIVTPDGDLPVESEIRAETIRHIFESEGIEVEVRTISDEIIVVSENALHQANALIDLVLGK